MVHRRHADAARLTPTMRWIGAIVSAMAEVEETGLGAGVLNHPARGIAWLGNRLAQWRRNERADRAQQAWPSSGLIEARHMR